MEKKIKKMNHTKTVKVKPVKKRAKTKKSSTPILAFNINKLNTHDEFLVTEYNFQIGSSSSVRVSAESIIRFLIEYHDIYDGNKKNKKNIV